MVSPAFAEALAALRPEFNAMAAEARRRHPGFDHAAFTHFLVAAADPVVLAVAGAAPARVPALALAAFRMGLDLVGQGLADGSPRTRNLIHAWATVMPPYAALAAEAPDQVLGMLSNAVLHLDTLPGVDVARWGRELAGLAGQVRSLAQLRALGQVLAWRAGAAHYRPGALAAADLLPQALALAAVRASGADTWDAVRANLVRDPWWRAPGDIDAAAHRSVGAFAGFGGPFATPPTVYAADACFLVRSGEHHFVLHADAHGAILLPAAAGDVDAAARASRPMRHAVQGQEVVVEGQRVACGLPATGLAVCATDATIALSSPYSHAIQLVPRR